MRKMTDKEKELANYLVKNKDFEKDEYIALGLLCNSEIKAEIMLDYLKKNPNIEFDKLLKKAVEIYQSDSK